MEKGLGKYRNMGPACNESRRGCGSLHVVNLAKNVVQKKAATDLWRRHQLRGLQWPATKQARIFPGPLSPTIMAGITAFFDLENEKADMTDEALLNHAMQATPEINGAYDA